MSARFPPGCERCMLPITIVLEELPIETRDANIRIFRCPGCSTLILDDLDGHHGHGTTFRATEAMIEGYVRDHGIPPEWMRS